MATPRSAAPFTTAAHDDVRAARQHLAQLGHRGSQLRGDVMIARIWRGAWMLRRDVGDRTDLRARRGRGRIGRWSWEFIFR
jgi:hypothetical protein